MLSRLFRRYSVCFPFNDDIDVFDARIFCELEPVVTVDNKSFSVFIFPDKQISRGLRIERSADLIRTVHAGNLIRSAFELEPFRIDFQRRYGNGLNREIAGGNLFLFLLFQFRFLRLLLRLRYRFLLMRLLFRLLRF